MSKLIVCKISNRNVEEYLFNIDVLNKSIKFTVNRVTSNNDISVKRSVTDSIIKVLQFVKQEYYTESVDITMSATDKISALDMTMILYLMHERGFKVIGNTLTI